MKYFPEQGPVSVGLGCRNKIPQLKQQELPFSQFWRLKAQAPGLAGFGFCRDPLPGLQMAPFPLSLHGRECACARGSAGVSLAGYKLNPIRAPPV